MRLGLKVFNQALRRPHQLDMHTKHENSKSYARSSTTRNSSDVQAIVEERRYDIQASA